MPPPFKTVAVIGKNDATVIPMMLEQVVRVLRRHGATVLMDSRTAEASVVSPDETLPLSDLPARADLAVVVGGDGTRCRQDDSRQSFAHAQHPRQHWGDRQ